MSLAFPKTVRAAKTHDLSQWAVADALLREAREEQLPAVVEELKENGIEHTVRYLNLLRQAAEVFGPNRRHENLTLRAHVAAGNPETLDVIAQAARQQNQRVSLLFVEDVLREMRAEARAKSAEERKRAAEEEREAAEEEKKAQSEAQREAAKAKRKKAAAKRKAARSPRRKDLPAPKEKDVNPLAARAQFTKNANEARRLADKALKLIRPNLDEYSPAAVAGLLDACLIVANRWREVANTLAAVSRKSGRSLLSVVNE